MAISVDPRTWISSLSELLGSNEYALQLLISLLIAYPIALVHRRYLFKSPAIYQHVYFTITGLVLTYFNFGVDVYHGLINILVMYVLMTVSKGRAAVVFALIFNMAYLIIGYYYTSTKEYDIKWTTPHCVLCLRLTGWAYDIYDGHKPLERLSADQKKTAITYMPSLFQTLGHMYFPCACLVGPQFPMTRYMDLVNGTFCDKITGGPPNSLFHGFKRLFMGLVYTSIYHVITSYGYYFNDAFILSQEYMDLGFIQKMFVIMLWAKLTLYKYVACWLVSEGSCVSIGLSYNGKDENGNDLWDACGNIKIRRFEKALTGQQVIQAFNINTNRWVMMYVYKRLKFMNNRLVSQVAALGYLAVWHGLHSGYYNCFAYEFVVVNFERDMEKLVEKLRVLRYMRDSKPLSPAVWAARRVYCLFVCGYPLISFILLKWEKYSRLYGSLYWCGHVALYGWPLVSLVIKKFLLPRRSKRDENGPSPSNNASNAAPSNDKPSLDAPSINAEQHTKAD